MGYTLHTVNMVFKSIEYKWHHGDTPTVGKTTLRQTTKSRMTQVRMQHNAECDIMTNNITPNAT